MLIRIPGRNAGLCYGGEYTIYFFSLGLVERKVPRPYLHMYSQPSEVEDLDIISLEGCKVEFDPSTDALFGVSPLDLSQLHFADLEPAPICLHHLHVRQFLRSCCSFTERAAI